MTSIVDARNRDPGRVLFVCDFTPPRGPDPALLEPARDLRADFISVAYNPGKSVRVTSALAAHWIERNTGKDTLFTVATRDMNKLAVQSMLLGAGMLGLENAVVVKGDRFTERELSAVKAVDDFTPTGLLAAASAMKPRDRLQGRQAALADQAVRRGHHRPGTGTGGADEAHPAQGRGRRPVLPGAARVRPRARPAVSRMLRPGLR